MIETVRSVVAPAALLRLVRERYGLDARSCTLLRSLNNDVYEVADDGGRYALKVYGMGGRSLGEVVWEQQLAVHLADAGIPVASPVALADGRLADHLEAPEGPRPFALTRFVEGRKPTPPFDDALYRSFGRLIGRVHLAAQGFRSDHARRSLDRDELLDGPLAELSSALAGAPEDLRLVHSLGVAAGDALDRAARDDALRWGVRHGDVTLDNLHLTEHGPDDRLVLHDFDRAAPGWLAADLTGVHATGHWGTFRDGYLEVADLTDAELDVLPWFGVTERISNLAFHLVHKPRAFGTESIGEGWAERELAALREAAASLLPG